MTLLPRLLPAVRTMFLGLAITVSAGSAVSSALAQTRPTAPSATPNAATATPTTVAPPVAKPAAVAKPPAAKPPTATAPTAVPAAKPPAPTDTVEPPNATDPAAAEDGKRYTALVAFLTLKVLNPTDTRKKLEQELKALGGFPVTVTDRALELKVPPAQLSVLLERIAAEGLVVDKALQREDLTLDVAKLSGQLKSKRAILAELRSFFDSSDVTATLHIERSMTELVEELENVKGSLRVLHERSHWAVVHVNFEFKERQRIVSVTSPFEWLNTVTLDHFLETF